MGLEVDVPRGTTRAGACGDRAVRDVDQIRRVEGHDSAVSGSGGLRFDDGIAAHEGVGLVMVRDESEGDLIIGQDGVYHLDDDRVTGTDPLAAFGPNAASHLRRTSSFTNCPDLIVNSFYDPVADEGAAFEELIGFHGGLGGKQTAPFVLVPTQLVQPTEPLVGARSIHELFTAWLDQIRTPPG